MYVHKQRLDDEQVQALRREAGTYLRETREARGITQREMAARLEAKFWTFVSGVENGQRRLPPDRYEAWAKIVGVNPVTFVIDMMRFYDPITHAILFEDD